MCTDGNVRETDDSDAKCIPRCECKAEDGTLRFLDCDIENTKKKEQEEAKAAAEVDAEYY